VIFEEKFARCNSGFFYFCDETPPGISQSDHSMDRYISPRYIRLGNVGGSINLQGLLKCTIFF
jgi:hypothetical protein